MVMLGHCLHFYVTSTQHQDVKTQYGAGWRRGRVSDSGPRGPGFDPQPGSSSLWPRASQNSTAPRVLVRN